MNVFDIVNEFPVTHNGKVRKAELDKLDAAVAKLSDVEGKGMCKNQDYVDYLKRSIDWRLKHETV